MGGVDQADSVGPGSHVELAGCAQVEEDGPGGVEQREHRRRTVRCPEVQVGHPPSEQRVALAEVVVDVEAGDHPGRAHPGLIHRQHLEHGLAERHAAIVDVG